jgi:hypothetical protein
MPTTVAKNNDGAAMPALRDAAGVCDTPLRHVVHRIIVVVSRRNTMKRVDIRRRMGGLAYPPTTNATMAPTPAATSATMPMNSTIAGV